MLDLKTGDELIFFLAERYAWVSVRRIQDVARSPAPPSAERPTVSCEPTTPFDSIESSHEYVALLAEAIGEAVSDIEEQIRSTTAGGGGRRLEALQLVVYKLEKLRGHIISSRRLLNDLRSLRRLLLGERLLSKRAVPTSATAVADEEAVSVRRPEM